MRHETNNEIDLLLRRMSGQDGGSMRDGEHLGQHLDGDELSSYAQNALPAAARARYTEHLAECSTCRKLVTELSLSLGATAAAAAPVETVVGPSALRKFLASLFSPMVLRYAVPALGLIIVAAIGFVILRERGHDTFVAQLDENQRQPGGLISPEAPAPASSPNAPVNDSSKPDRSGDIADPKEPVTKSGDVSGAVAGTGLAPAGTPAQETAASAPQPSVAAEPPPAKAVEAAKIDAVTESEEQRKEEQKKKDAVAKKDSTSTGFQAAETQVATAKANEPARDYNRAPKPATADRVDESKRESLPLQRGVVGGVGNASRSRAQTDKDDAETRTVSGRRFRKERGIWTDTAYDSSTATVSMARGSEQFRALIADEPEIKKIAEQLDGEVIVVWKGRAYRIR